MKNIHNTFFSEWMRERQRWQINQSPKWQKNNNQNIKVLDANNKNGTFRRPWLGNMQKDTSSLTAGNRFQIQTMIRKKRSCKLDSCVSAIHCAAGRWWLHYIQRSCKSSPAHSCPQGSLINPRCELAASCFACVGPLLGIPAILLSNLEFPDNAL